MALKGRDTLHAFSISESGRCGNPNYAPTYIQLMDMYRDSGKFTDKPEAATYLEKSYQLCPSGRDGWVMCYLKQLGSNELKAQNKGDRKTVRSAKAADARREAAKELAIPLRGAFDTAAVLSEFLNSLISLHV